VIRLRRSDFIEATYAFSFVFANFGIADRGQDADDDDDDQKFDQGEALLVRHHVDVLQREK